VFVFLILLFILLPLAELWVIIELGGLIGIWPTLALLLFDSVLGAVLLKSQGTAAWRRFQGALGEARVPAKEIYDGAAIVFGGALLLTPGFITDIVGFALLIPPTRAALRRLLVATARRAGPARSVFFLYDRRPSGWRGAGRGAPGGSGASAPPRRPRRDYDFDGNAREIRAEGPELDAGDDGPR
jgi:UPF0716 protein FxsA